MTEVAVIGSGSWGTAIARLLGKKGAHVRLWSYNKDVPAIINETHRNPRYLPDVELCNTVCSNSFAEVLDGADCVVVVCPSSHLRSVAEQFSAFLGDAVPVVVLSKGVEAGTGLTMHDVLLDVVGHKERLACLSGPNHAEEVSREMYAASVVASTNESCAEYFQELFTAPYFRVYTSRDVIGVELCAASKNIVAIANGMCVAMELGDNASAALVTRGVAEITRLVVAMGGDALTCMGLAGMGDLVVTCNSPHSRNRSLGELLVEGGTLEQFQERTHMVAEGAVACVTVTDLSRSLHVEMPIAELVRSVLMDGLDPHEAARLLYGRPNRPEQR